ncbi:Hsp70 family protein [Pyxidicoccus parkwayensis]|uniref:Hsp70 family protein n=1 Tax=Pyxidicoccus parkwayensis TaxID=2813578 RepID=A0ABX7P799_9BACT|nr:Hsp70 family protein [Pyxidicoccus parkwaysis]QSQ26324.1 Hsp70 family protein [Pyxidicoccus parkwaysis]
MDFGTTKTLAAWDAGGEVRVCEPIPSVVWFDEDGRKPPHVGHLPPEDASSWVGQPGVKRQFGESAKRRWFPQEVAAHVLGELRARLPAPPAGETLSAVLTAPASWGMRQRAVLREAAELAGFHVRRVLPEPEALAVWWSRQPGGMEDRLLLTVNFGGGTVDVAMVETESSVVDTLAIGGAPIGGFDLDSLVLHYAARTARVDPESLRGARLRRFMAALENAKIATLAGQNGQLRLWRDEGAEPVVVDLRGEEILRLSAPLLDAACKVVRETRMLVRERAPSHCLLIGGSARIQRFRAQLMEDLVGTRLHECCGDEVARGALFHAQSLAHRSGGLLVSALPRPVGILLEENKPAWLLQQGHSIPFRKSAQLTTERPQSELRVHVVEGGAQPGAHELLGSVALELPPPAGGSVPSSNTPKEELHFGITLDLNAEMEIVAELHALGVSHRQTVISAARLNAAQKSVMGRKVSEWVKTRRTSQPQQVLEERLRDVQREAKQLAEALERKGSAETVRRLREMGHLAEHHLSAGATLGEGETAYWEALRSRARLMRALGSVEGEWPLPSPLSSSGAVAPGVSLLAAARGEDRQWLAEAQAELDSARRAGTLRTLADAVLPELPPGRGRLVLAVLAAPSLSVSQVGQVLSGARTPWEHFAAVSVALVSEEPDAARCALELLLDWADRAHEEDRAPGLPRSSGEPPLALSLLRALYPESFVSPLAELLWLALRPGSGRDAVSAELAARAATPLTRAVLAFSTERPDSTPDDAPRRLRLARDVALALAPGADAEAWARMARWREEDAAALERAVTSLGLDARTRLVARAAVPGQETFLAWLLASFDAMPGGLTPLLHPMLEQAPEQVTLWKAIRGIASRELEGLAVKVLLRSSGSAAVEGAATYLRGLSGKVSAGTSRFYFVLAHVRTGGRLGLAGALRVLWTWLTAPEMRPAAARLLRGGSEESR